jgi:peptidoglycan/xylan/chitin deacetylase (PgdA/CDA1 family)
VKKALPIPRIGMRVLPAAVLVFSAVLLLPPAGNATYVVFTVDVCWVCGNDFQGNWRGKDYGIPLIVSMFEKYGVKGSFFVSPLCPPEHDAEMLSNLRYLTSRGQDLELHPHPDTFDVERPWFNMYSEEEKKKIIAAGIKNIERAGAPPPIAHRAGGYSIDRETLRLLPDFGIRMDSSIRPQVSRSEVPLPWDKVNRFTKIEGIYQLPITQIGLVPFFGYTGATGLGLEWTILEQQTKALKMLADNGVPVVTIFAHFNSLYHFEFSPVPFEPLRVLGPNEENIKELEGILKLVTTDKRFTVVTARQLWKIFEENPKALEGPAYIPYTGLWTTYVKSWRHFFGHSFKNKMVVLFPFVVLALSIVAVLGIVRMRRRGYGGSP